MPKDDTRVTTLDVTSDPDSGSGVGETRLIDINSASAPELANALPGIGAVLSQRIVAHREANGPFVRADQIMGVSGIGPATYEAVRSLITVGE